MQIVNPKGEMKGSAITGPVGKEAAELWPVRSPHDTPRTLVPPKLTRPPAYCQQLGCCHVKGARKIEREQKKAGGRSLRKKEWFQRGVHSGLGLGKAFFHEMETSFLFVPCSVSRWSRDSVGVVALGFDGSFG